MTEKPFLILGLCLGCLAIAARGQAPVQTPLPTAQPAPAIESFEIEPGKYQVALDATRAPELSGWAEAELKPVIEKWYPQIVALLPGAGYQAPRRMTVIFKDDLGDTPAYTMRAQISCNVAWFEHNLRGEARGAVVHEMVHVVQRYGPPLAGYQPAPGWVVEGIADYIRWFLYEPESRGAEIPKEAAAQARYDAGYRVSANFLDWLGRTHDKELVVKLNTACREGRYQESLWKAWTGKTVQELGEDWQAGLRGEAKAPAPPNS